MIYLTPTPNTDSTTETETPESHDIVSFIYATAQANAEVIAQMTEGFDAPWQN